MSNYENEIEEEIKVMLAKFGKSILNKKDTAFYLDISTMTLDRMRLAGDIRSIRVGGQVKFRAKEIARLIVEG
ncbi:hypothetical protein TSL6_02190 [Sulfurovum sp. TSL6]|uniref:hypothetical protein n=1 Tax=Sulfurovum sp. TSL6 TaxID=2826995 RepID=UPI001CC772B6|nr:hypothetical protein [Sulfurovum sp. TSL6]GIT99712.1 hypothetical protein TSL6_02190 [Sulfurovum sp. TSL6]